MNKYEKIAILNFGDNYRKNKATELIFKCPKCGRQKLYFNTQNGVFHCFRCDYKGRLKAKSTIQDIKNNYNFNSLQKIVKNDELNLIYFNSVDLTEEQKQALKDRGLTDSDIKYYNICGRKEDNRIQIPNFVKGNFTDIICAWQYDKTKINNKNPKYLNSEGTKKDNTLFNIYNIEKGVKQLILCEGIFNAITAGKNAVASYGCNLSDRQLDLIIEKEPKSILIAYDSDEPGVKGSLKAIDKFKNIRYKGLLEYILLPNGVDINDLGQDNFMLYYNNNKVIIDLDSKISLKIPKLLHESRKCKL